MDKREQTRKVRHLARVIGDQLDTLREEWVTEALRRDPDVVEATAHEVEAKVAEAAELIESVAAGGTRTCRGHAETALMVAESAKYRAAEVRRAVEAERVRRAEVSHTKRTVLERDFPALAAVVACAPADTVFLGRALALVAADDYRAVLRALDSFGVGTDWDSVTLPDPEVVTEFITEDTDARELAGVIRAYVEGAEQAALYRILDAARATGWCGPGEVYPDAASDLDDGEPAAVHGGGDDMAVAEAAALAVGRYGIFDDLHRPDDFTGQWHAHVVPGVPVWPPHVQAWRRDVPHDAEILTLRQADRASVEWDSWGQDTYLIAYAEAYAEAILDAETPPTVGEDEDSGVHPEDRAEQARERAEAATAELGSVGLGDLNLASPVPDEDEIAEAAEADARHDYREAHPTSRVPEGMAPLF